MEPCTFLQLFPFVPPDVLCRIHEVGFLPTVVLSSSDKQDGAPHRPLSEGESPAYPAPAPRYEPLEGVK